MQVLLQALLVILVILLLYIGYREYYAREGMAGKWTPRDILDAQISQYQGNPPESARREPIPEVPQVVAQQRALGIRPIPRIEQVQRSAAKRRLAAAVRMAKVDKAARAVENPGRNPEKFLESERGMWSVAKNSVATPEYNTELAFDQEADVSQQHAVGPALDYESFISEVVVDPRQREQHNRWVQEMLPYGNTGAMKVDTLDAENYISFLGLRRPQAVAVDNPMQATQHVEVDELLRNKRYNFMDNAV